MKKAIEKQGKWLFRWRSYLPLLILPILLIALRNGEYLERVLGNKVENIYEWFCVLISMLGLVIRCLTVGYVIEGSSGINTKSQKARILNTTGMYSIVRHPLYFGNFIIFLGIILFPQVLWFTLIAILAFWLYYERIMLAEEEFLKKEFGDIYLEWVEKTPAFIPKFKNWQQQTLPFSFKKFIKREYSGFFAIIASFTFMDIAGDLLTEGKLKFDLEWVIIFMISFIVYITVLILKKKTHIFDTKGR